jgi:uncharacterized oxidoreductase
LAKFGESLCRELKGEGVHVMMVHPGATDTPMMRSSRAGPELGFTRQPASAVAAAVIDGMEQDAFEVLRGGEARAKMIALNREDPAALESASSISSLHWRKPFATIRRFRRGIISPREGTCWR